MFPGDLRKSAKSVGVPFMSCNATVQPSACAARINPHNTYVSNKSLSAECSICTAPPRGSTLRISGLPQNLWAECRTGSPSSDPQRARVLAAVQARRSAPPPLRGAHGVDTGSAHARPGSCLTMTSSRRPHRRATTRPECRTCLDIGNASRSGIRDNLVLQHPSDAEGERDAVEDYASSAESVGEFWFGQVAKCVIQSDFQCPGGAEPIRPFGDHSGLSVEAFDNATGELPPGSEPVQNQVAVRAQPCGQPPSSGRAASASSGCTSGRGTGRPSTATRSPTAIESPP